MSEEIESIDWEKLNEALARAGERVAFSAVDKPAPVSSVRASIQRSLSGETPGAWVSVRPCKEERTYLGIMLGSLPTGEAWVTYHPVDLDLHVWFATNPCIFVPELGRVVWGYESWWGRIRSPEDLRQIGDGDIENIWYVQALKSLSAPAASGE